MKTRLNIVIFHLINFREDNQQIAMNITTIWWTRYLYQGMTDVTYLMISVNGKRAYLSTILDLETRDWVAYQIHYRNEINLFVSTLQLALTNIKEKDLNGLTLHSDQGSRYLSTEVQQICVSNGIRVSQARKANPLDNAVIECLRAILKKETLYHHPITSLDQYISLVHEWMTYYNTISPPNQKK